MERTKNFTAGPILPQLVRFAFPVLLALFLQSLYGAVDLLIVGRFAKSVDLSAVSTGSQIMMTLTNLAASFSMGTTILLAQRIGEGREKEGGSLIGASLLLFLLIGLGMTALMTAGAPALARTMNAPREAFSRTVAYTRICGAGTLIIIAYNLIGSIFRGMGDSRTPLITVAIATVVNIVGDLLLVALLHLGAAGAAIATVSAQAVSVICSFFLIRKQKLPFRFRVRDIRWDRSLCGSVIRFGLPLALSDLLVNVSFLVLLAIANSLGLLVSAGVGVAEKVCAFIMLIALAMSQSLSAFSAQNIGAGRFDRARRALRVGIGLSLCAGAVTGYLTFFHGDLLAGIFSKDRDVILVAWQYLKAYAIDCLLTSFLFCFIGFFNGCGMTRFVMAQGITGAFGVRVPVSYLMSRMKPVNVFHIGLATPASTLVQIVLCFLGMRHVLRERNSAQLRQTN